MTYDQLPLDDRARLAAFMGAVRPVLGEISRVFGRLARLEDAWSGGVSAIVAQLDAGEHASPASDLAGAAPLTKESIASTMNDFAQAMALFNSDDNRQRYVAAAGIANTL